MTLRFRLNKLICKILGHKNISETFTLNDGEKVKVTMCSRCRFSNDNSKYMRIIYDAIYVGAKRNLVFTTLLKEDKQPKMIYCKYKNIAIMPFPSLIATLPCSICDITDCPNPANQPYPKELEIPEHPCNGKDCTKCGDFKLTPFINKQGDVEPLPDCTHIETEK
jgi:hypothetical protein